MMARETHFLRKVRTNPGLRLARACQRRHGGLPRLCVSCCMATYNAAMRSGEPVMLHLAEVESVVDSSLVLGVPLLPGKRTPSQNSIASQLSEESAVAMGVAEHRDRSWDQYSPRGTRRSRSWSPDFQRMRWRPTSRNVLRTLLSIRSRARRVAAIAAAKAAFAMERASESIVYCCCLEIAIRRQDPGTRAPTVQPTPTTSASMIGGLPPTSTTAELELEDR